jgi:murein DD-endopeptidase MepM/ murein hydrolase activator NlpD
MQEKRVLFIIRVKIVGIMFLPRRIMPLLLFAGLSACAPAAVLPVASQPTLTRPVTSPVTTSPLPGPTAVPTLTETIPFPTPTNVPALCSPLKDVTGEQMAGLVSNPYYPPAPGSDDPHHGVDLAMRLPGSQVAVTGHPVQAALPGIVAAVVRDRFPYGNAVMIETSLEEYPASWWEQAQVPTPAPTLEHRSALTCPDGGAKLPLDKNRRSLYVLYAHLLQPPGLEPGEAVTCGQAIGLVGSSGNALNPHLHFETRVGPAGLRLESMAHYDASASAVEMSSYCLWRISGVFQLVDPMKVLALLQP